MLRHFIRHFICATVIAVTAFCPAMAQKDAAATVAEVDSVSAAVATVMGPLINKNIVTLRSLGLDIDNAAFVRALDAYLSGGNTGFTPESADIYIDARVRALHPEMGGAVADVAREKQFMDSIAATDGAVVLPSGVVLVVLQEGEGGMPVDGDRVLVSYEGRLSDGSLFDSTAEEGPITLDVNGVVAGFSDGLKQMRPGGTYRIVIPADKAYGTRGIPGAIPGNSALDFTVQLLSVTGPDANN